MNIRQAILKAEALSSDTSIEYATIHRNANDSFDVLKLTDSEMGRPMNRYVACYRNGRLHEEYENDFSSTFRIELMRFSNERKRGLCKVA